MIDFVYNYAIVLTTEGGIKGNSTIGMKDGLVELYLKEVKGLSMGQIDFFSQLR